MKTRFKYSKLYLAVGLTAFLASQPVHSAVLEEILVTATKRAESAQDIAQSIQVIQGAKLTDMAISDIGELSTTVPNFSVGDGVTVNLITVRGVGSGEDRSFEQSVSMFQDGQYMPRSRQTRTPFFDAERVEILRGPQAVLFGLNSTAGAISIISAKNNPGDEFEGSLTGEYESEFGGFSATGVFGGSPSENLGLRLAVRSSDTGDGYINEGLANEAGNSETTLARLTAVWAASENVEVTAKYDHADYEVFGQLAEPLNRFASAVDPGDGILNYQNAGRGERLNQLIGIAPNGQSGPGADQSVDNAMLKIETDLSSGHVLTAQVGYSDYTYKLATDLDGTAAAGLGLPGVGLDATSFEDYQQTSAELRIASPLGETFEYIAGIYYHTSDLVSDQSNIIFFPPGFIIPGAPLSERGNNFFFQDQTLFSSFVSGTWNVSDQARLIGGVRYSDDEKDWRRESECQFSFDDGANFSDGNLGGGACALASDQGGTEQFDDLMPELAFQYDISDNTMAYVKYGESAKSGGAATGTSIPDGSIVYGSESSKGFEIGLKSTLAGGAAQLNITYFNNDFDDLQVKQSFVQGTTIITAIGNAGSASSDGVEIEGLWAVSDMVTLGANVAFLDATFDEYNGIACNPSQSTAPFIVNGLQSGCVASGQNLPFAADFSGSVFADLNIPFGNDMNFFGNLTVSKTDDHFTDGSLEPSLAQESYTRVDARLGVGSISGNWSVALIGKNLSDEVINQSGQPLGAYDIAYLKLPRTLTLQGTYRF